MNAIRKGILAMLLLGCLMFGTATVFAEEYQPGDIVDGSTLTHELQAEGIAYPKLRGTYFSNGTGSITLTGSRTVLITGSTTARQTVDSVKVTMNLQRLKNNNWTTVSIYGPTVKNNAYHVSTSRTCSVTGGYYYRMYGGHTVIENGAFESATSCTNGIWVP